MTSGLGIVPVGHDDSHALVDCAALLLLRGVPLVRWAVEALVQSGTVSHVVVPTSVSLRQPVARALDGVGASAVVVEVLPVRESGWGAQVLAALRATAPAVDGIVVVHDPLYALAPASLVAGVVDAVADAGPAEGQCAGVVPLRLVTDTLKWTDREGVVTATADRDRFRVICSPQAYRTAPLRAALDAAVPGAPAEDVGAALLRLMRHGAESLVYVDAPGEDFRIATSDDLALAEALLQTGLRQVVAAGSE